MPSRFSLFSPHLIYSQDQSTIAIVRRLDDLAVVGNETAYAITILLQRLVLAEYPELPLMDQLHNAYSALMDAAERAHLACGKYLFYRRRALALTDPSNRAQLETRMAQALEDLAEVCKEVRTRATDAAVEWKVTRDKLHTSLANILRRSWAYDWLLNSLNPEGIPVKRAAVFADLPTLHQNAEQSLDRFGKAYTALENTIEAAGVDDVGLQTAMIALVRVDLAFSGYKHGLFIVIGEYRWLMDRTPLSDFLAMQQ
jgi:hypothetical protein